MPAVRGTALSDEYESPEVQAVARRAVKTMLGEPGGYESTKQAAQDVLDMLYTAMLFGAFKDYEPQVSQVYDMVGVERE